MSYENSFSLKIIELPEIEIETKECSVCRYKYTSGDIFCRNDLSKLITTKKNATAVDIISQFRLFTDDCELIKNNGDSAESGDGRSIESDLIRFSESLSGVVFQLNVEWDSGLGDRPQRVYIKNGKSKTCNATIVFDEYKEEDLK